jgi:hypothetical protein
MPEPVGHWADLPQPATLDQAMSALGVVVNRVKGSETDNTKAAFAATVVVGFGISQIPHDHPAMFASEGFDVDAMDAIVKQHGAELPESVGAAAIPWASILAFVTPLILEWLRNRK